MRSLPKLQSLVLIAGLLASAAIADDALPVVSVEGQPLAANVRRIVQAFAHLGQPLPADLSAAIETAARDRYYGWQ